MNAARRKQLQRIRERIEGDLTPLIAELMAEVEDVKAEEEEAVENLPDSLRDGDQGQRGQEAVDALDLMHDALTECETQADEAISQMEEAVG